MNPHPQVLRKLEAMTPSIARRYLRRWMGREEQDEILAMVQCQPERDGWLAESLRAAAQSPVGAFLAEVEEIERQWKVDAAANGAACGIPLDDLS